MGEITYLMSRFCESVQFLVFGPTDHILFHRLSLLIKGPKSNFIAAVCGSTSVDVLLTLELTVVRVIFDQHICIYAQCKNNVVHCVLFEKIN